MIKSFSIGFSPCPNDTFIFYALMQGLAGVGLRFADAVIEDVEALNARAIVQSLDVTKLSFHALGHVLDKYVLLRAGSALGRGCGPLLVAGRATGVRDLDGRRVAVPGRFTTAAMLLRLFAPHIQNPVIMRFDEIMPAIRSGAVDAGVIIHEGRFTYARNGLILLQDLGAWWEEVTGAPIPLGGIAVKRSLGADAAGLVNEGIRESVRWANANPERCMPFIRGYARELSDRVIQDHINLYVNAFTEDLGEEGTAAVSVFLEKGREAGVLPAGRDDFTW